MKILLPIIFTLITCLSCTSNDEVLDGVYDFSGKFKFANVNSTTSEFCQSTTTDTYDLEIFSDGSFEQIIYLKDSNNDIECGNSETLNGKIEITNTNYFNPQGMITYDNSSRNFFIILEENEDGKHNTVYFKDTTFGSNLRLMYTRVD